MLIPRPTFLVYLLSLFIFFLGSAPPTWADSLDELKKALQANDVEAAWKTVDEMPQKISTQQREETVKVLTSALKKEWARCAGDIRQSIAIQLAAINAKESIPDLLELIREKKNIEHECAECGCCFNPVSVSDLFTGLQPDFFCENSVMRALQSLATFSYAKEISELVESNTAYRPQLLVILGKIGHPRYAHFISKFADRDPLAVAQALGVIKQPSGIPVLSRLLESSDGSVRWTAAQSLILIKGDRVVDSVKLRLPHPNQDVSALAARTLGVLGVADGLPVLRNLSQRAEALRTRALAIAYLGQLKDLESRAIFIAGLKDKSLMIRAHSIYAMGFVGKPGDIPMIEASLIEAKKTTASIPEDREAMGLIDETTRETLEQIRRKPGQEDGRR
jgi:HEAT repeat protein